MSELLMVVLLVLVVVVVVPGWACGVRPRLSAARERRELAMMAVPEWEHEMREASSYEHGPEWPSCCGCGAPARGAGARWCWPCSKSL